MLNPPVAVVTTDPELLGEATSLADRLALPLLRREDVSVGEGFRLLLVLTQTGLELRQTGPGAPGPVAVDFGSSRMRHRRRGGANETLGRAVGVRAGNYPAVLDANAGLARDGFVLADLGCRVILCERVPVLAAMLEHALQRSAGSGDNWLEQSCKRMQLWCGDCRDLAPETVAEMDVIYLDPMFPARRKSALVKKEMVVLQALVRETAEAGEEEPAELLRWALAQDVERVVLKRPGKSPFVAGLRPAHQLTGKSVRFDVYLNRR